MKKLNVFALCALLAPAYMLGIGNVTAAERDITCETERHAGEDIPAQPEGGSAGGGNDSADMRNNESQESGNTDQPVRSGDTDDATAREDGPCEDPSTN